MIPVELYVMEKMFIDNDDIKHFKLKTKQKTKTKKIH